MEALEQELKQVAEYQDILEVAYTIVPEPPLRLNVHRYPLGFVDRPPRLLCVERSYLSYDR